MIAATFHGPNHFRPNHDESTIEVFANIGEAIAVLFERYESKGDSNLPVHYLNGGNWRIAFPHVELGDSFECYSIEAIQPGWIEDALTAVHAGLWDYKLRLMRPFTFPGDEPDSKVAVAVEKRVK